MTVQTIDSGYMGTNWQDVLTRARDEGVDVVIEQNGEPAATLIPYQDYLAVEAELDAVRRARQAERQVEITDHPHIVRIEGVHGGDPIVSEAYVSVETIVGYANLGMTPDGIVELYDGRLTLAHVYDALSYYHDHKREIDNAIAKELAILERLPQIGNRP